jgi:hypothetical protein
MVQCSQMCSRSGSGQLSRWSQTSQLCPFAPRLCACRAWRAISRLAASRRRCSACVSGASSRAPVQRTCHATPAAVEDMCVDHGGAHVALAEQLLKRPDVVAILEQVCRERVPKRVAAGGLRDAGARGYLRSSARGSSTLPASSARSRGCWVRTRSSCAASAAPEAAKNPTKPRTSRFLHGSAEPGGNVHRRSSVAHWAKSISCWDHELRLGRSIWRRQ